MTTADQPVRLDPDVDEAPEFHEHPVYLEPGEAEKGAEAYGAVDDLADGTDAVLADTTEQLMGASGRDRALSRARTLRKFLLTHGVPEVSIELVPGRPAYGDEWNACNPVAVLSHHIASVPSVENPVPGLWLVKHGRSDLPGPLANGTAGVDLVYRILCMGMANHPGFGGPWTVRGPVGSYRIPRDVARPYVWGTEYEGGYSEAVWDREYVNRRTGKRMTFREFMGRANAGLVEGIWHINGHGKTPPPGADLSSYHGEHKTWAPGRKPDRLGYDTARGRAEIRKHNTNQQEDDVSAKDVWGYKVPVLIEGAEKKEEEARFALARARKDAANAEAQAKAAHAQADRNRAAIKAMGEKLDGLAPGVSDAVLDALGDRIHVDVNVRVDDEDLPVGTA